MSSTVNISDEIKKLLAINQMDEFLAKFQEQQSLFAELVDKSGSSAGMLMGRIAERNWVEAAEHVLQWSQKHGGFNRFWFNGVLQAHTPEMMQVFLNTSTPQPYGARYWLEWRARSPHVEMFEWVLNFISENKLPCDITDAVEVAASHGHVPQLTMMNPLMNDDHRRLAFFRGVEHNHTEIINMFYTHALRDEAIHTMNDLAARADDASGMRYLHSLAQREELERETKGLTSGAIRYHKKI